MSRAGRRTELAAAYVLHHRPWRDTSRLLDVFARDHGRMALFARGVRGPKSRLASLLQPFQPLLLCWSGNGDPGQLTRAEPGSEDGVDLPAPLPPATLMSAWYLNELLLKLTTRLDPQPALYLAYEAALAALRRGEPAAPVLRRFELQLLELLGYGLDVLHEARSGGPVEAGSYYHFHPSLGFVALSSDPGPDAIPGTSLLALATGRFEDTRALDDARRVMRIALDHLLEGRELRTRAVAQAVARRPRPTAPGDGTDRNGNAS
ncbi:MAG: DNA repair protein RecO [Steroidobacteraceae bacterium]|jgi:DNA repair protein RecO (recombination protein O)|nr:DNA repair protein RecO [Steroidobacteraceae bacterium]